MADAAQDPAGGASTSWIKGRKGGEGEDGKEKGKEGKGEEGMEGKGRDDSQLKVWLQPWMRPLKGGKNPPPPNYASDKAEDVMTSLADKKR